MPEQSLNIGNHRARKTAVNAARSPSARRAMSALRSVGSSTGCSIGPGLESGPGRIRLLTPHLAHQELGAPQDLLSRFSAGSTEPDSEAGASRLDLHLHLVDAEHAVLHRARPLHRRHLAV